MIDEIVAEPEIGKIYEGKVVKQLTLELLLTSLVQEMDLFILANLKMKGLKKLPML